MALQFIIGRAGSGKSTYCLEQIRSSLKADPMGDPIILLVPEQASFLAEHALVTTRGLSGIIRAQVLSFRRMAHRVLQETGGIDRLPLDDMGKKLLLYRVLEQRKDELKLFGNAFGQMGTIEAFLDLINEMKRYTLTPDQLADHVQDGAHAFPPVMADKLHDLSMIYHDYELELASAYFDAEDVLNVLAEQTEQSEYLARAEVWIDGFHGFTPQELAVIRSLLLTCSNVKLTLCLNRTYEAGELPHELDLFYPTAMTMIKLKEIAAELGVEVLEPIVLQHEVESRFAGSPMLAHLERNYDKRTIIPYESAPGAEQAEAIVIHAAMNRRAEAEGIARDILMLARQESCRWRDMAILVRNMEDYQDVLAEVLQDYDIPFFIDQKRAVTHHPLIEFVRSALDAIHDGWRYDSMFRCIKTDFFLERDLDPLDRTAMDELENYVLAYGIHGARWLDDQAWNYSFTSDLEARSRELGTEEGELLGRIHSARKAVITPLAAFEKRLGKSVTVHDYIASLYDLLEAVGASQRLESWSQQAAEGGNPEKAREHTQVWNRLMDMFDQMVEVMGDKPISLELFIGLIDTGTSSIQLGHVPPALDQVLVGSVERTHSSAIKHAFILGVNDGVFPQKFKEGGLISEQERERLISGGVELAPSSRRKLLDEQFLIYTAITGTSASLRLSYSIADDEGKALLPSELIRRIKRMFPSVQEKFLYGDPPSGLAERAQLEYAVHPARAMGHLVSQLRQWLKGIEISPVWWDVYNWITTQEPWSHQLKQHMYGLFYTNMATGLSTATSRELYGSELRTSVSRMEKFAACPFAHFAAYGLRLQQRKVFRLEAPDIGQLFHAALSKLAAEILAEGIHWGELTMEQCRARAERIVDSLAPKLQGQILLSSKRYAYISRKLKQIVGRASVVLSEHARRGDFMPVGLEVGFGTGQELPPLTFQLENGCTMQIVGRIDRVDSVQSESGLYVRVIDYKSSRTMLRLADVYYGLSLQMLTYLDVILTFSERWLGQPALPAGVLYFHVHQPLLQTKNAVSEADAAAELFRRFQMKGYVAADPVVLQHMDRDLEAGRKSEIVPVALKKDGGFYKYSTVVTPEQWTSLREYVRRTIRQIGSNILAGEVAIAPYRTGQLAPCHYCEYRALCQFDPMFEGNEYNVLRARDEDELWNQVMNMTSTKGGEVDAENNS